ncbi:MAG: hypothetical protein U0835_22995 [Isosphaeraceae bacterium]
MILEGEVHDAKTMADILQLVTNELRNGRPAGAGGGQGGGGGGAMGGGGGGQGGGGGGATAIAGSPFVIINRVRVPGPRQVLLRVKIAELNRTAIRELGISWLNTRNNAILGSTIGGAGGGEVSGGVVQSAVPGPRNILGPIASTYTAAGQASPVERPALRDLRRG